MEDFTFMSPTEFVLERGAELRAGAMAARFANKALLVTSGDPFLYSSGLHKRVNNSLKEAGVAVCELSGVQPNPLLATVRQGIALCRQQSVGFVLALGGGSVVDTAKAVALGAVYEGDVWDFYTGAAAPAASLPVGAVMTLPATGSEGSNGSVITNGDTGEKRDVMGDVVRPVFCLMNPELCFTLPPAQTAYGVADMFSHVTERYFGNSTGVQLSDELCEGTMRAIVECGLAAMANGKDYNARANLMWAAVVAHNGLLGAGRNQDWATHMIGAPLSGTYNSVHGGTISVLLPVWAEYVCDAEPERFSRFARQVFGAPTAREGIDALRDFFAKLGLPRTLREIGLPDDSRFEEMAQRACFGGQIGCVKRLGKEDIMEIYRRAF